MLISSNRVYTGRVLNLDVDTVQFPDGSTGTLEMIRHPGASAVLPFLDDPRAANPRIILIRQFRHASDGFVWEVPAGRLDPGEAPEACAQRELNEETGYRAGKLERLTTIYTTPGFTDEQIHLFLATELTLGDSGREPDEFLEVHPVRWNDALEWIRRGEMVDGKSLAALTYAQCFVRPSDPKTGR